MELETQTQLALNQLKRQTATVNSLHGELELKSKHIKEQQVCTYTVLAQRVRYFAFSYSLTPAMD